MALWINIGKMIWNYSPRRLLAIELNWAACMPPTRARWSCICAAMCTWERQENECRGVQADGQGEEGRGAGLPRDKRLMIVPVLGSRLGGATKVP